MTSILIWQPDHNGGPAEGADGSCAVVRALYRGYAEQWGLRAQDWKAGRVAQKYKLSCELVEAELYRNNIYVCLLPRIIARKMPGRPVLDGGLISNPCSIP